MLSNKWNSLQCIYDQLQKDEEDQLRCEVNHLKPKIKNTVTRGDWFWNEILPCTIKKNYYLQLHLSKQLSFASLLPSRRNLLWSMCSDLWTSISHGFALIVIAMLIVKVSTTTKPRSEPVWLIGRVVVIGSTCTAMSQDSWEWEWKKWILKTEKNPGCPLVTL